MTTALKISSSSNIKMQQVGYKKIKKRYAEKDKLEAIRRVDIGERRSEVCRLMGTKEATLRGWLSDVNLCEKAGVPCLYKRRQRAAASSSSSSCSYDGQSRTPLTPPDSSAMAGEFCGGSTVSASMRPETTTPPVQSQPPTTEAPTAADCAPLQAQQNKLYAQLNIFRAHVESVNLKYTLAAGEKKRDPRKVTAEHKFYAFLKLRFQHTLASVCRDMMVADSTFRGWRKLEYQTCAEVYTKRFERWQATQAVSDYVELCEALCAALVALHDSDRRANSLLPLAIGDHADAQSPAADENAEPQALDLTLNTLRNAHGSY